MATVTEQSNSEHLSNTNNDNNPPSISEKSIPPSSNIDQQQNIRTEQLSNGTDRNGGDNNRNNPRNPSDYGGNRPPNNNDGSGSPDTNKIHDKYPQQQSDNINNEHNMQQQQQQQAYHGNMQQYRGNYGHEIQQQNAPDGFNPFGQRGYGGKPLPGSPGRPPSGGGYQQQQQPPSQRFLSGQSISQPSGPTPTLNQLLQSSTGPQQQQGPRYSHNNYPDQQYQWGPHHQQRQQMPGPYPGYRGPQPQQGGAGGMPPRPYLAGPGAPQQQQSGPPQQQQQQQQPPPPQQQGAGSGGSGGPGAGPPSGAGGQQYPPYPQRYPTPPGPGRPPNQPQQSQPQQGPYPPHQMGGSPYGPPPHHGPPSQQSQYEQQQQRGGPPPGATWGPQQSGPPSQQPSGAQQAPPPSQQSPVPSAGSSSGPTPGAPSPAQQVSFPNRPGQSATPNAHGPDGGDQNSNDSSSGHGAAPGTPNSQQGLSSRPTPSPTGSTGSRSMSPAVQGQPNIPMPPRPSSGQSDGAGPAARMSHSPMATQGGYPPPPSHMQHPGYKMGPGGPQPGGPMGYGPQHGPHGPQHVPQHGHGPQHGGPHQPYQQGNYSSRPPMGYGGPGGYPPHAGPHVGHPGTQGAGSPYRGGAGGQMPNHLPPQQPPGQFYPSWGPPGMQQGAGGPPMHGSAGKGQPPSQAGGPRPHTPPNYLKQHLQQKMGFGSPGMPPSSPSGTSGPYPPPPGGMGPPTSHPGMQQQPMGPPGPPMVVSAPTSVPPTMPNNNQQQQQQHMGHHHSQQAPHDSPLNMPPPASTPNSHPQHPSHLSSQSSSHSQDQETTDNGITTTATGSTGTSVTSSMAGSVTSVITTGPDGAPLDDGSQQSTLSNASAASGEEQQMTPKSSRGKAGGSSNQSDGQGLGPPGERGPYGPGGHPPTPQSNVASPGAASMNSMHEDFGEVNSPSWPRTPASPVYNSHISPASQDPYRPKLNVSTTTSSPETKPKARLTKKRLQKPDSLGKLYEMDENPERRPWLDKLLQFMDERGTPINACPTISKNTLDLFRLYFFVKDRAGFMEVTKAKTWKDVAGQLGIGASSSAAYTLRKHYTKHLLPFECHFDRGGIDPQPIISQVEASTKKKGPKASSVPSPGSSNSQDSFPPPGSGSASMDGYGYGGYPPGPGSTPDYGSPPMQQQQRPASQSNAPSPHPDNNVSISNPFDDPLPPPPLPLLPPSSSSIIPSPSGRVPGSQPPSGSGGSPSMASNSSSSCFTGPHFPVGGNVPPLRPQGMQPGGYQGQPGFGHYPPGDQYGRGGPPDFAQQQQQQYPGGNPPYQPGGRPMYPPYGPEGDRGYGPQGPGPQMGPGTPQQQQQGPPGSGPPSSMPPGNQGEMYSRWPPGGPPTSSGPQGSPLSYPQHPSRPGGYGSTPPVPPQPGSPQQQQQGPQGPQQGPQTQQQGPTPPTSQSQGPQSQQSSTSGSGPSSGGPPSGGPPSGYQQEYYRPDQPGGQLVKPPFPGSPSSATMMQQPRPPFSAPQTEMTRPPFSGPQSEMPPRPPFTGPQTEMPIRPPFSGPNSDMPIRPPFSGPQNEMQRPPFSGPQNEMQRPPFSGPNSDMPIRPPFSGPNSDNMPIRPPFTGPQQSEMPIRPQFSGPPSEMPIRPPFSGPSEMPLRPQFTGPNSEMPLRPQFTGPNSEMPIRPPFTGPSDMPIRPPFSGPNSDMPIRPPFSGPSEMPIRPPFSGPSEMPIRAPFSGGPPSDMPIRPPFSGPNAEMPLPPHATSPHKQPPPTPYQVYPGQPGPVGPTAGPQQMYPGSPIPPGGPGSKAAMPPPAPQPRRHPDFNKDQQQQPYPPYGQQRPSMYGWGNNSQFGGRAGPGGPYPGPVGGPPGPGPQQWGPRPPGPPGPGGNQWEHHRYPPTGGPQPYQQPPQQQQWMPNMPSPGIGQSSPLRPPMGGVQQRGSLYRPDVKGGFPMPPHGMKPGMPNHLPPGATSVSSAPVPQHQSSSYQHHQLGGKRDHLTFPPDSVEATMPVLYKRRRMGRSDVAPVEAWRIMMSLRSGLLAESCWALDVLNVLLFDDNTVAYFGLANLPGLLDVLLEHFRRSLTDMFDDNTTEEYDEERLRKKICNGDAIDKKLAITEKKWYETPVKTTAEIDLGCARNINLEDKVNFLVRTENYSQVTRKGSKITIVPRDSDPFIDDSKREWDETEPWDDPLALLLMAPPGVGTVAGAESDSGWPGMNNADSMRYIVPCFRAEFGTIPFVRLLSEKGKEEEEEEAEEVAIEEEGDESKENCVPSSPSVVIKEEPKDDEITAIKTIPERKNCDKTNKKRTKTLSDVLSRIKKEPLENSSTEEEMVVDLSKEINQNITSKTEEIVVEKKVEEKEVEKVEKEETPAPVVAEVEKMVVDEESEKDTEVKLNGEVEISETEDEVVKSSPKSETPEVEGGENEEEEGKLKLCVKDPAGTLRRKRLEDYEDESYARDEASLTLINETQEGVAKRCLCIANILRSLTFIPGNELEFAKNTSFLSLLGKLILLNHEHPIRATKQRNYDRDEDAADCADASCSSLAGVSEWWWDHLHILRESVLVMTANISGQLDLGQHPEEISRPIFDGLLHWAVCPAAYGQDPFPTSSSLLSPQRLALEALCKLCVTDSNVDLLLATPPHSRLERLCATLARLLCRSEEQPLREFAVNLLHSLAAAASSAARVVAMQAPTVSLLLGFIEQAEQAALAVANQHGIQALRDNPESMGTSLDMLRRAAGTLLHLSRHRANRPLFLQQEHRLLALVMSQILDQHVAAILSRVLYQCSRVETAES